MPTPNILQIFRDWVVDGVPSSGAHDPVKSEIRAWGTGIESEISALAAQVVIAANSTVASIAALKAVSAPAAGAVRYLTQPGRAGFFVFRSGDYSAKVTADTLNGVYVKANDTAATSGAWVRDFDGYNWNPKWFGAVCDQATDDYAVYPVMLSLMSNGHALRMPDGLSAVSATITINKRISIIGAGASFSGFYALGFSTDQPIFDYVGDTVNRIQNIRISDIMLRSSNNAARGLGLTWVNLSTFSNIYFYNLYRGASCDYAWSNTWTGKKSYGVTQDDVLLLNECNHVTFSDCAFTGKYGVRVTGNTAALHFDNIDIEGTTDPTGAGILLAPTTGKKVMGVNVVGGYWEAIRGNAISTDGADADSVQGLRISGGYFYGGYANKFSSLSGTAQHAIALRNVTGFDVSNCHFYDWQSDALYTNGSAKNGRITLNPIVSVPALTNGSFPASVTVTAVA